MLGRGHLKQRGAEGVNQSDLKLKDLRTVWGQANKQKTRAQVRMGISASEGMLRWRPKAWVVKPMDGSKVPGSWIPGRNRVETLAG